MRTGKWSEISTVRIQNTVSFPKCLHLDACVILVGLVIVGIKPAEKYFQVDVLSEHMLSLGNQNCDQYQEKERGTKLITSW